MSSTRRQVSVDIYPNPLTTLANFTNAARPASAAHLQHVRNPSMTAPVKFEPTYNDGLAHSPLKPSSSPISQPILNSDLLNLKHFPPPTDDARPHSPVKRSSTATQYHPIVQKPPAAAFASFHSVDGNFRPNPYLPPPDVMSNYRPSVLGKHAFSDDQPRERPSKKARIESEEEKPFVLPDPEDMPPVADEVDGKRPPYSYATLIGMAILRAPNRRLTLSNIYKWISESFTHYRNAEAGWTNSIRHNLSLSKAFTKIEKPKEDPGKGHYWTIEPGHEKQFFKDNASRRAAQLASSEAYFSDDRPSSSHRDHIDSSRFPAENEISSDATIAASEEPDEVGMAQPQSSPVHMNSSPPVARRDTPPKPLSRFSALSRSGNRRKHVDFRDSGFFSSIESSATRPLFGNVQFSSPPAQERSIKKRGRAEDELARIRGSSYELSPVKKPVLKHPGPSLLSSSPLRNDDLTSFPLTPCDAAPPAVPRTLPTASPSTHLRRHRESIRDLIGTPAHGLSTLREELHFTPQFEMHHDPSPAKSALHSANPIILLEDDVTGFHGLPIFADCDSPSTAPAADLDFDAFFARGSPMRSTVKRPVLQRAATATGTCVLSDINNTNRTRLASPIVFSKPAAPIAEPGPQKTAFDDASLKTFDVDIGTDFWAGGFDTLDSDDGVFGLDLTKGFGKIGSRSLAPPDGKENAHAAARQSGVKRSAPAARGGARPAFGRSLTNVL